MAQSNQDDLVSWLESSNFTFLQDALVEEGYTLDMIVDMTDEDMNGIFEELKISNLKRPRFRNAVKRLKHNPQSASTKLKQGKEETFETIEDYSQSKPNGKWCNLAGTKVDVENMIYLWNDIYMYKNESVAFKEKENNNNNDGYAMNNSKTFNNFLQKIRAKIVVNECNDGLIFYYSGHGVKNGIILGNGSKYPISKIIEIFNGENCVFLRNKPKIMIFDCCRGSDISQTYESKSNDNKNNTCALKGPNNPKNGWINERHHKNSGLVTIFSNFEDFSISDSATHGGCLTRSILKMFENPSKACKHSLRELIIGIRRQAKINSGVGNKKYSVPNELVDFRETLEYKVYFDKNVNNNNNNNKNNNSSDETKEEKAAAGQGQKQGRHEQQEQLQPQQQKQQPQPPPQQKQESGRISKEEEKAGCIGWRFDFHYDYQNKGSKFHGIYENGRRFQCNRGYDDCYCFSTIVSSGMVCNSGIYKITFKIDDIKNCCNGNILGLTRDNFGSIDLSEYKEKAKYDWSNRHSYNWIGWTAHDKQDDIWLPNGLYCGNGCSGRTGNIFRGGGGFKYMSRNGAYCSRLPVYRSGDKVVLIYNSDLGELSFELYRKKEKEKEKEKENSNSYVILMDSYISNLPRDLTFYWFCGHWNGPMSVTILD